MRLAIFYPDNVLFDGINYKIESSYRHHQMYEISKHFDATDFIVFSKSSKEIKENLEIMDTGDMNIIGLPGYREVKPLITETGWEVRFIQLPYMFIHIARLFYHKNKDWDVILLVDPYFTNQFVFLLAKFFKKPAVLFLGARYDRNMLLNIKYESFDRKVANHLKSLSFAFWVSVMTRHLPTVVTGGELYDLYKRTNNTIYKIVATITRRSYIDKNILESRNYKKKDIRLLTVCRVTPEKAIEDLIEVVSLLAKRHIDVHLDIIGPIISRNYLSVLISRSRELLVEGRVHFIGVVNNRDDLMKYYANADIYAISSISEGSPKVIPEAMAKGLPIVATRVGGIPELIQDGENGILVNPHNVQELTEAIETLSLNPDLRRRMGQNSLEKAEEYSIENQMKKFADIIKATLNQR